MKRSGRRRRSLRIPIFLFFGDVSSPEDCVRVTDEVVAAFGDVDVLVNNAAKRTDYPGLPFWRVQNADWLRIAHTNCDAFFYEPVCRSVDD
jgi:NAD(P)-dependent dehydrogenase (short-subunit alcohol dehydrogenase family)